MWWSKVFWAKFGEVDNKAVFPKEGEGRVKVGPVVVEVKAYNKDVV